MTALRKIEIVTMKSTVISSLDAGEGVSLFSSGSAPLTSELSAGDCTALFSSGSAPMTAFDRHGGDACGAFSSTA